MASRSKKRKAFASVVVAAVTALSLTIMPGLASAQNAQGGYATGQVGTASEIPEWAIDDGQNAQSGVLTAQGALPNAYDLRFDDLVTSVKFQNPWGSCWAFGGTAAAEISLLSAYGSTYEKSQLDLSERHLTYFALQPVTAAVNSNQVGEGMHTFSDSPNAAFDAGGVPIFITTLFSQGVGPVVESMFPYRGVGEDGKSHTSLEYLEAHPDEVIEDQIAAEAKQYGKTYDAYLEELLAKTGKTKEQLFEAYKVFLEGVYKETPTYTKFEDWSIPDTNASGASNRLISNGVVLKNGNVLPEYWDNGAEAPNEASKNAIKQELLNGHGVSIKFFISQDAQYAASDDDGVMYNQYVYGVKSVNHGVCIVGWDDNYGADEFVKEAPDDGAWIVKNSWGSETDWSTDDLGNVINKSKFGVKNDDGLSTGYFYLSYYDSTIAQPETMEFTANLGSGGGFYTLQHDYMPAYGGFYSTQATSDVTSSANVYDVDKNIVLKSVSTRTNEANQRVTFAIYKLNDNAKDPADGEMIYRTSQNFEYGGFHRLDLDRPITIQAGQKFSVVSTVSKLNDDGERTYNISANRGISKEAAEYAAKRQNIKSYSEAVVNKGESFLYSDGKWQDWSEYIATLPPDHSEGLPGDRYIDQYPIDNFSIKVYAESEVPSSVEMYRLYNPNSGEHFYTASAYERDVLVAEGWSYEGLGWTAPSAGDPVYRLYNPNAGDHHYTSSAYEKDSLVSVGWNYEGVGWLTAGTDGVPLYRQYNPNAETGTHNYTTSQYENDYLVSIGWRAEGIGWYGVE